MTRFRVQVVVEAPAHASMQSTLTYSSERTLPPGTLLRVPLGAREVAGLVWDPAPDGGAADDPVAAPLRPIVESLDGIAPLAPTWRQLVTFAAGYYQRSIGEVALAALPGELRKISALALSRRLARRAKRASREAERAAVPRPDLPDLSPEQAVAVERIDAAIDDPAPPTVLLFGATGSGKTEVYLRATERALDRGQQALVLVPEINLTPQLVGRFAERFPDRTIVSLHSGLTPAARLSAWLGAHHGDADVVLGTRLAAFASMPRLGLVVVDEEHDPSYKQQEGARYSARDLAIWRGRNESVPVVLGSATPSLETWHAADTGRYARLVLAERFGGARWPAVRLVDMNVVPRARPALSAPPPALAPQLVAAIASCIANGEQALVFLNRRGYAPVLHCPECGWQSGCPDCSAWRVFHKEDRTLRCHHCGLAEAVPRRCPDCGNPHIEPIGRGTERLEEQLAALLPEARIARIDADAARRKGALAARLADVHEGRVDILVGTQMVAKGHDFRRIGLVAAINPDTSLFSSDFRAPERLFALLMQAAGRAGRDAARTGDDAQMWLQTWRPSHPLYAALARHDYEGHAAVQLEERRTAGLPPWSHLAVLRAEARTETAARAFLDAASTLAASLGEAPAITTYAPVPLAVQRVAGVERMQMLVESTSRPALQAMLRGWLPLLRTLHADRDAAAAHGRVLRWAIDVDPLTI